MEILNEKIEQLRAMLSEPELNVVILSHTNPDGDAVGSSIAWAEALRRVGHRVTCIVPNKYPYYLDWMSGIKDLVVFKQDKD